MTLRVNWTTIKELLYKIIVPVKSPVFLTMLGIAFVMWYALKLSHIYTTDIAVPVRIEGERYRIKCMGEARGTELWAQRLSVGGKINIPLKELSPRLDSVGAPYYTISHGAMANAIMQRTGSLRVIEVLELPEISSTIPVE